MSLKPGQSAPSLPVGAFETPGLSVCFAVIKTSCRICVKARVGFVSGMRMQAEISPKRRKAIIAPGNISVILICIYIPSSMGYFSSIFPIASQKSSPFPKIPSPRLSVLLPTRCYYSNTVHNQAFCVHFPNGRVINGTFPRIPDRLGIHRIRDGIHLLRHPHGNHFRMGR